MTKARPVPTKTLKLRRSFNEGSFYVFDPEKLTYLAFCGDGLRRYWHLSKTVTDAEITLSPKKLSPQSIRIDVSEAETSPCSCGDPNCPYSLITGSVKRDGKPDRRGGLVNFVSDIRTLLKKTKGEAFTCYLTLYTV